MGQTKGTGWIWFLAGAMLLANACSRKPEIGRIYINVIQNKPVVAYINGYRSTVSGQVLEYHSSHPDADLALLARANKEASTIEWKTDPIPEGATGDFYQLVWLAGLEREGWPGKEVHTFDLYVNGELWFTFQNRKDAEAKKWKVTGKHGAELSFDAQIADRAGDLFGYMFLRVPKNKVRSGTPLTLRVTGRNSDSLDWYMTLQYAFRFAPTVRAEPALTAQGKQLLRLSFDNLQDGRSVEVGEGPKTATQTYRPEGGPLVKQALKIGANIIYFSIPEAERVQDIPVVTSVNGELAQQETLWVKPVFRRELYLLSYSHNDIGYTDIQPEIEKKQWRNLDAALGLIRQTQDYPWEARYRWNLEVMWPLEGYMKQASEPKRQEVIQAIRNGSLGLNALYANVLTGLANSPETAHFTEYARRFSEQNKIPITTALVSDIPGFSWGIVSGLAHSGVKYFASAPNSGDRIGYVLKQWGDKPFYWTSQSGAEKILMWVAGASYASFHEGDLTKLGEEKVWKLMRKLEDGGYPYQILQLPYTVGGDNGPPDPGLADFVKKWNETYLSPRLVLSTHSQMFTEFEKRYGAGLPTLKGDFTPYWEDGAASTAAETALNRRTVDRLIQGEALWALRSPASYPEQEYQAAWKNVVLWDEHTWGAHNSVSDPDLASVKEQWRIKRQFALDADRMSQDLLARLPGVNDGTSPDPVFDVYNTHSWPRTDLVVIDPKLSASRDLVLDSEHRPLPSQRLSTGELAVLVENLPPFSGRRLRLMPGKATNGGTCKVTPGTLGNSILSLSLDAKRGIISSLTWGEKKIEMVDRSKGLGLDQYLYVPGKDAQAARPLAGVKVRVKENGGLVASLLLEAQAPGCRKYTVEYRIVDGIDRVEIIHQLDKLPVRTKEAIHIAFPFDVPGGQLRYDVADGIVRPEADQLPGSCKNFFSVQSWADISNADRGVTWATADAPLIEIGSITAEQPWAQAAQSSPLIYSYLMNNYWHTNYKADQEGPATFRFAMYPHGSFKPEEVVRSGRSTREPLVVLRADTSTPVKAPLFLVSPAEVLVSSLKPLPEGKGWLIALYNPTAGVKGTKIEWNREAQVTMMMSDNSGHPGIKINTDFKIPAWGTAYVRVDK
jgi:alpha-mannosidase